MHIHTKLRKTASHLRWKPKWPNFIHRNDYFSVSNIHVYVWKCVNGVSPTYLRELCVPVEDVRGRSRLRSASLPRVHTSTAWTAMLRVQRTCAVEQSPMHQPCANFIGFTYFLLLSIPSLSTRIVPLRLQAGGRRRRPNLCLVCCVCVTCIP